MNNTLTQDLSEELLAYDGETGVFTWKLNKVRAREGSIAGTKNQGGYIMIGINGKQYGAHRMAWIYENGCLPECIDHIDHDESNNRIKNLRNVTCAENSRNQELRNTNSSGFLGVTWVKRDKRWSVRINFNGKRINIGGFKKLEEAILARKNAEKEYGYHKNHGKTLIHKPT